MATAAERKARPDFDTAIASHASAPAAYPPSATAHQVASVAAGRSLSAGRPLSSATGRYQAAKPPTSDCLPHTVRDGETLFSIAATRLGDGRLWPKIRTANGGIDPTRLRAGQKLAMPCAATPATGRIATIHPIAAKPIDGKPIAGKPTAGKPIDGKPVGETSAANKPVAKPVAPQPVWTAKSGEDFAAVMKRWSKKANHILIIETTDAWTLATDVRLSGPFREVVGRLIRGLAHDGTAPPVRIHPNRVVRIGL